MRKLTILSLVSSDRNSGPGAAALTQARLLQGAGHRVLFACLPGKTLWAAAEEAGLELAGGFRFPRRGEIWRIFSDAKRIRALAASERVDLAFVHQTVETIAAALALRRSAAPAAGAAPLVRVWHDGSGRAPGRMLCWWMRRHGIGAAGTSPTAARALARAGLGG
ncbi:MAG: glycosyltransferase, partial [Planctomycetota bacterium]